MMSTVRRTKAGGSRKGEKEDAEDAEKEKPLFNMEVLQLNSKSLNFSRTFMSIVGGIAAGILGLTGLAGFAFYFAIMALLVLAVLLRLQFNTKDYFLNINQVVAEGLLPNLLSYVLFWTLAYDCVHLF